MSADKHLWEFDHPYYGPESCYYATGIQSREANSEFESWQAFVDDGGYFDADLDMNFLYRWDWLRDTGEFSEPDDDPEPDRLLLFYMGQRKGFMSHHSIVVTEADEPAVREWLTVRAEHMRKVWEPLLDGVTS